MRRGFLLSTRERKRSDVLQFAATQSAPPIQASALAHDVLSQHASHLAILLHEHSVLVLRRDQDREAASKYFQRRQALHRIEQRLQSIKELCAMTGLAEETAPLSVRAGFWFLEGLDLLRRYGNELKHTTLAEDLIKSARLQQSTYELERMSPEKWPAGWEFYYGFSPEDFQY